MTSTTLFKLSDAVKQNYKLKRPIIDQFETFLKSIKLSGHYISDTDALQWFLRRNDVFGFILYVGMTTENEIRVTMSVEKQRLVTNRKNLNKLNDQI
ncbi:hypothetical protein [Mammaliicoccus fleurettii]|uniref:hypothetical protein n=1 Tax=Mammaliicoccus fleurettii TaxID=150056 RepID=UPI002DBECCBC|nr:hypothetical protein [Mammaliicoccus fleurettii]MEB7723419.1 hypothetical protein [Mammaliicoccus fleurettii]